MNLTVIVDGNLAEWLSILEEGGFPSFWKQLD